MSSVVPRGMSKKSKTRKSKTKSPQKSAVELLADDRVAALLNNRRFCYHIEPTDYVSGKGYRVSIVIEDEPGRLPTGRDGVEPWFWGFDLTEARAHCTRENRDKLGLTELDTIKIVTSSMFPRKRSTKK